MQQSAAKNTCSADYASVSASSKPTFDLDLWLLKTPERAERLEILAPGFVERLIGSIRRECIDHIVVLSEVHLRQILQTYAHYYNDIRTHRSLNKDAPLSRPVQRIGSINSHAILGGLHHHYVRV
jgi:hypothetical protein